MNNVTISVVGRRIKQARQADKMSHDALAARAGTSRQHLIKLEKGQHKPTPGMLARIAEATGRSVEWFTRDDDEEERASMFSDLAARICDFAEAGNVWAVSKTLEELGAWKEVRA